MDEVVHANEHRMAARGNATSFPLPWQDLWTQFSETAKLEELGKSVSLPRIGEELIHVVSILLKTSNAKDDADNNVALNEKTRPSSIQEHRHGCSHCQVGSRART